MNSEHSAIINGHNPRLARQLARMVGLFGSRGWGEIAVVTDDGTVRHFPVTQETQDKIQYVRKLLKEYNQEPITT